jgi:hypothetical protein
VNCGARLRREAPVWNEIDSEWEERPRGTEELVQFRRRKKRLVDCELPEGFRLVTPEPRQFWLGTQVRWGFCLGWAKRDRFGNAVGEECFHVARYEPGISDEVQLRWAVDDFTRELDNFVGSSTLRVEDNAMTFSTPSWKSGGVDVMLRMRVSAA